MTRKQYLHNRFLKGTATRKERIELVNLVYGEHFKIQGEFDVRYFSEVILASLNKETTIDLALNA